MDGSHGLTRIVILNRLAPVIPPPPRAPADKQDEWRATLAQLETQLRDDCLALSAQRAAAAAELQACVAQCLAELAMSQTQFQVRCDFDMPVSGCHVCFAMRKSPYSIAAVYLPWLRVNRAACHECITWFCALSPRSFERN